MKQLTSIVAMGRNGEIGVKNRLPWRVQSDLRFFRRTTQGQIVIMGRRTRDSLGRCLPDRMNIILSHRFDLSENLPDCKFSGSIDETLLTADKFVTKKRAAFVIGGATMYEQFAPFVDRYLITFVDKTVDEADTFFRMDLLGDLSAWERNVVAKGDADGSGDEVAFEIVEFSLRDNRAVADQRRERIDSFRARDRRRLEQSPASAFYASI